MPTRRAAHRYTSLTRWFADDDGNLGGEIEMPIKVGTVGGPLQSNPTVALNLRLLGVERATELAEVMGAVGLAQNFSALRALATDGIQKGHMTLHARSVAMAAGATPDIFDTVVDRLIQSKEIKVWKARDLVEEARQQSDSVGKAQPVDRHAVLRPRQGHRAGRARRGLRSPCHRGAGADGGAGARCGRGRSGCRHIDRPLGRALHTDPRPGETTRIRETRGDDPAQARARRSRHEHRRVPRTAARHGARRLRRAGGRDYPRAGRELRARPERRTSQSAGVRGEKMAHGTPSGVDNTVATYGETLLYRKGEPPLVRPVALDQPLPIVIGMTGVESLTAKTVATVRRAWERNQAQYERLFDEIDALTLQGLERHADRATGRAWAS